MQEASEWWPLMKPKVPSFLKETTWLLDWGDYYYWCWRCVIILLAAWELGGGLLYPYYPWISLS
ncbi:hypothetical protein Hanom_Chr05g00454391 [Helianthus anomalus]